MSLPSGQRGRLLKELESHLLDEADSRNVRNDEDMRTLLAEKDDPENLARDLCQGEASDFLHRHKTSLLAGLIIGLVGGLFLWFDGKPLRFSVLFGLIHGLVTGTALFCARRHWLRLGPNGRTLSSILLASLMAFPLAYLRRNGAFVPSWILYGAWFGYLFERFNGRTRSSWVWIIENLLMSCLVFTVEAKLYNWFFSERTTLAAISRYMPVEMGLNAAIQSSVYCAVRLREHLAQRWLLRSFNES